MLKVCSVKDLLFRISSARVKFRSRPVSRPFLFPVGTGRYYFYGWQGDIIIRYVIFIDPV